MNNGNQRKNEMKEIENEIVEIEKVDTEKKQKQNCYSEKNTNIKTTEFKSPFDNIITWH